MLHNNEINESSKKEKRKKKRGGVANLKNQFQERTLGLCGCFYMLSFTNSRKQVYNDTYSIKQIKLIAERHRKLNRYKLTSKKHAFICCKQVSKTSAFLFAPSLTAFMSLSITALRYGFHSLYLKKAKLFQLYQYNL